MEHGDGVTASSIAEVYYRYGVPFQITEARGGWISTHCPHCAGSADWHLGYNLAKNFYKCWRCGGHPTIETLAKLCHVDRPTAAELYRSITSAPGGAARAVRDREAQARVGISRYRHPGGVGPMESNHRRYLEGRGFEPDRIAGEWGVLGTGPTSRLDGIDYRFRLLVPIVWDGAEVSFQARDVTGKSDLKYISCPPEREARSHKTVLYGRQESWGRVGVVVEGVTDCWRLGPMACATFGIQYRPEQVLEIADRFERVFVIFDAEPAAQEQARMLAARLRMLLDEDPIVVDLGGGVDPGSLSQDDADHLMRELT